MRTYSEEEIKKELKKLAWDCNLTTEELHDLLTGKISNARGLSREWLYARIFNTFRWHKILRIIPKNEMPDALNDDVIRLLWPASIKKMYAETSRFLRQHAISFAG